MSDEEAGGPMDPIGPVLVRAVSRVTDILITAGPFHHRRIVAAALALVDDREAAAAVLTAKEQT